MFLFECLFLTKKKKDFCFHSVGLLACVLENLFWYVFARLLICCHSQKLFIPKSDLFWCKVYSCSWYKLLGLYLFFRSVYSNYCGSVIVGGLHGLMLVWQCTCSGGNSCHCFYWFSSYNPVVQTTKFMVRLLSFHCKLAFISSFLNWCYTSLDQKFMILQADLSGYSMI